MNNKPPIKESDLLAYLQKKDRQKQITGWSILAIMFSLFILIPACIWLIVSVH